MVQVYLPPVGQPADGVYASCRSTQIAQHAVDPSIPSPAPTKSRGGMFGAATGGKGGTEKKSSLLTKMKNKLRKQPDKGGSGRAPAPTDGDHVSQQRRSKVQIFDYASASSARKSMKRILTGKVQVSAARAALLENMRAKAHVQFAQELEDWRARPGGGAAPTSHPPVAVLLINFLPEQAEAMTQNLGSVCHFRTCNIDDALDWKSLVATTRSDFKVPLPPAGGPGGAAWGQEDGVEPQVVVVRLAAPHVTAAITSFDELPEREQCLLGVHFMANRYVITFVDFPGDPHGDHLAGIMQAYMPQAYPVCNTLQSVMQCCGSPDAALRFMSLRRTIHEDVRQRLQGFASINYALYAAARMPGAIVPFGVQLTNFLDMLRLTDRMLRAVGMTDDAVAAAGAAGAGRLMWLKNAAVGALNDIYTFTAGGAVTLSLTSAALAGEGFAAALSAFAATDLVFVGAMSVISGAVSAITGAVSRPHMVAAIAELVSTMQTLWLWHPDVRRSEPAQGAPVVTASIRIDPDIMDAPDLFPANDPNALLSPEQLAELIGEPECPIVTISYQDIQSEEQPRELGAESWTRSSISSAGEYTSGVGGVAPQPLSGLDPAGGLGPPGGGAPQFDGSTMPGGAEMHPGGAPQAAAPWASGRMAPGVGLMPPVLEEERSSAGPSQLSNGGGLESREGQTPADATEPSRASEDVYEVPTGDTEPVGVGVRQPHPSWLEDDEAAAAATHEAPPPPPAPRQHSSGSDARAHSRRSSTEQHGAWPLPGEAHVPDAERRASVDGPPLREPDVYPPPAAIARMQPVGVAPASASSDGWPPGEGDGGATELFDAHEDAGRWAAAVSVPLPAERFVAPDRAAEAPLPQPQPCWPLAFPDEHPDMQPTSTVSTTLHRSTAVDTLDLKGPSTAGFTNDALRTQHSLSAAAAAAARVAEERPYTDTQTRYDATQQMWQHEEPAAGAARSEADAAVPYYPAVVHDTSAGHVSSLGAGSVQVDSGSVTSDSGPAVAAPVPASPLHVERSAGAQSKSSGKADGGDASAEAAEAQLAAAALSRDGSAASRPGAAATPPESGAAPAGDMVDDAYFLAQLEREYEKEKAALSTEAILAELMREQSEQEAARMSQQLRSERSRGGGGARRVKGSMSDDEWQRVLQEDALRQSAQQSLLS